MRLAVLSFLPLMRGRKVLLHEDNQAVVAVLSHLTSRSPAMMDELRKLLELGTDSYTEVVPAPQGGPGVVTREVKRERWRPAKASAWPADRQ